MGKVMALFGAVAFNVVTSWGSPALWAEIGAGETDP
jgi:hypothetical protein